MRNVQRRLGKAIRDGLTAETLRALLETLDHVDTGDPFPQTFKGRQAKATEIALRLEGLEARMVLSEWKRNERRLRNLRRVHLKALNAPSASAVDQGESDAMASELFDPLSGLACDRGEGVWLCSPDAHAVGGTCFAAADAAYGVASKVVPFRSLNA